MSTYAIPCSIEVPDSNKQTIIFHFPFVLIKIYDRNSPLMTRKGIITVASMNFIIFIHIKNCNF